MCFLWFRVNSRNPFKTENILLKNTHELSLISINTTVTNDLPHCFPTSWSIKFLLEKKIKTTVPRAGATVAVFLAVLHVSLELEQSRSYIISHEWIKGSAWQVRPKWAQHSSGLNVNERLGGYERQKPWGYLMQPFFFMWELNNN